MQYSEIATLYEKLGAEPSKLGKTAILKVLPKVVLLSQGLVYPKYTMLELGIANQMMVKCLSKITGLSSDEVENEFKKTGDLGLTAEQLLKMKKQVTLFRKKLTVNFVFDNLKKLPAITGAGSQERKPNLIAELLASAEPREAKCLVRTILGELRIVLPKESFVMP